MRITQRQLSGAIVLGLHGRLTSPAASERLIAAVRKVARTPTGHLILDLEEVPSIDAGGIGALMASYGLMRRAGGTLRLARVGVRVYALLLVCRLVPGFETFDSVDDAVGHETTATGDRPMARSRASQLTQTSLNVLLPFMQRA
jgi:anti-anti-sigma factor